MIKKIFNLIKTISTSHMMIKSFDYGDAFSIQKAGNDLHPLFYLEFPFQINFFQGSKEVSFTYFISDIPAEGQQDDISLLSKIEEINDNIISRLQLRRYNEFEEITSVSSVTLNEWQGDNCVAISTEVTMRVTRDANNCEAPFNI